MGRKLLVLAVVLVVGLAICSFAKAEEVNYSYGSVTNKSSKGVTVLEYDYDAEKEVEVVYDLGSGVEIEDVVVGSEVDIEYEIGKDGKKVIKSIEVIDYEYEEEPATGVEPASTNESEE